MHAEGDDAGADAGAAACDDRPVGAEPRCLEPLLDGLGREHGARFRVGELVGGEIDESLKIVFDPRRLTYRHLLFEFFRMHNPTTRNQQGNDIGTQYRSAIFYLDDEQKRTAEEVIKTVDASGDWEAKVITEVVPFKEFWRAEEYHQKYLVKNPGGYTCHYVRRMKLGEATIA